MEFTFTPIRTAILAALLGLFWAVGGFTNPAHAAQEGVRLHPKVQRAWIYCMALFISGAAAVSVVDHVIGTMDPTNLRPLYVVLGILLMVGSVLWLNALKSGVAQIQA